VNAPPSSSSLADLAVLEGEDSGAPLGLGTEVISVKFVESYWRQCRPFPVGGAGPGLILQQNTGSQTAIVSQIAESRGQCGSSLSRPEQAAPSGSGGAMAGDCTRRAKLLQ
jgi:hypothetical protein